MSATPRDILRTSIDQLDAIVETGCSITADELRQLLAMLRSIAPHVPDGAKPATGAKVLAFRPRLAPRETE